MGDQIMINYTKILVKHYSNKAWSIEGNTYEGINWSDPSPKPTQSELESLWETTNFELQLEFIKNKAKQLIEKTDWAMLPDVGISNVAEFESYRSILREIIKNPVLNPEYPTEPQPVWL
jgi:hypothetical protein